VLVWSHKTVGNKADGDHINAGHMLAGGHTLVTVSIMVEESHITAGITSDGGQINTCDSADVGLQHSKSESCDC
jgi:hypothetical protein